MLKPEAPKGIMPCGHLAALYDPERGCRAVMDYRRRERGSETPWEHVLCAETYSLVMAWGERYPFKYIRPLSSFD